ncbi:MAG: nucleotidyltransferase domain-containing protein [Candidatus Nanoarchaeia archaeon]|jgi:predicted nucleotidyltransferase
MNNLELLSSKVKRVIGDNLLSMIVFGSYARGDSDAQSDVDLIVVVKRKTKSLVNRLKNLDYELSLDAINWPDLQASKFLNLIGFKKNIFLFDEQEFKRKKFNFCDNQFLASLLIPKNIIWANVKREGKLLHGKDLLDFDVKIGLWDKFKAPLPGVGACFVALFLFPFNKKKAINLAQTGLRWTYMNVAGILKRSETKSILKNLVEVFRVAFKGYSIN